MCICLVTNTIIFFFFGKNAYEILRFEIAYYSNGVVTNFLESFKHYFPGTKNNIMQGLCHQKDFVPIVFVCKVQSRSEVQTYAIRYLSLCKQAKAWELLAKFSKIIAPKLSYGQCHKNVLRETFQKMNDNSIRIVRNFQYPDFTGIFSKKKK